MTRTASTHQKIPPPDSFHRLIWQQAWRCWWRLPAGDKGFGLDDLFAEGLLAYAKFLNAFDPGRGYQFITGLTRTLMNHYAGIVRTAWRRPTLTCWDESDPEGTHLEDLAVDRREPPLRAAIGGRLAEGVYRQLSREAWVAARAALDPPEDFVRYCGGHRGVRMDTLLFDWLGYDKRTRARVRREIQLAVSAGAAA